jgi:hypothetical protein
MNRKNIDNVRFVDLDEVLILEIVPIQFVNEAKVVEEGFKVDAITKNGLRLESLFVDKQSHTDKLCYKFIQDNWVNAKK